VHGPRADTTTPARCSQERRTEYRGIAATNRGRCGKFVDTPARLLIPGRCPTGEGGMMKRSLAGISLVLVALLLTTAAPAGAAARAGQVRWAAPVSLPPAWFDPADATGILIPFMVYYALHDALVKPMPGNPMAPCLAESWSVSPDGLVYEFVLRR